MLRSLGRTNTWLTMRSWSITQCEFTEISPDHIELDINWAEFSSRVDTHDRTNHLGHDNRIPQVRFNCLGLLSWDRFGLSLLDLDDQALEFMSKPSTESPTDSSTEELDLSFLRHLHKLVEVISTEREAALGAFLSNLLVHVILRVLRKKILMIYK